MENERNNQGHFVRGHSGFKPKGAINKQTQKYLERVEWVISLLEVDIEENILNMSPKEKVLLWLELQKFVNPKLQRVKVDPIPEKDPITKITFEVVHSYPPPPEPLTLN